MTGKCEVCGNEYANAFTITTADGDRHVFDCFECAIHALAPACAHCQCKVIGHGTGHDGKIYCCPGCVDHTGHG